MKKPLKTILIIIIVQISVVLFCLLLCSALLVRDAFFPRQYVTTDLKDYGKYVGNYDNDFANEFIPSFFPLKIEDNFENVKYSYRAQKGDTYAFEAYLEFQIEDEKAFQSHVLEKTGNNATEFQCDLDFKEYVISNEFQLIGEDSDGISRAKIGKILYSENEHRIIYVAIGVYDGGLVDTDFLCEYFNRFDIDPKNYK